MNINDQQPKCRLMAEQAHTIIRLYGCLILSQGWLVWKTRDVPDPYVRKIFVQGYFMCFTLSTLVMGYKQVFSSEWRGLNWIVTAMFGILSVVYGWFLLTKKLPEFEHSAAGAV
mmetsp:Transcript_10603/g.16785  ORF Transcript_10603/g.16785 Transcript_10603/m.16785 type:complete len:114 (+) Transcript_10603:1-342(+)